MSHASPSGGPGHADLAVVGGTALLPTPDGTVAFRPGTTVTVTGGRIVAVDTGGAPAPAATETIDASGMLVVPGFVNGHTHAAMTLFRGVVEDVPMEVWFNDHIWPMEVNLTAEDVHWGTLLACAEMLRAGVTTVVDNYFFMDDAARAVERAGLRANLGWSFFSSQGRVAREATFDFAARWDGAADGRIRTSITPHAPYTCDDEDLEAAADAARRLGVRVHVHAAETIEQTEASLAARGASPIDVLERTGILDAGAIIAHGAGLRSEDVAALARHRDRVGVVHCPKGYLKFGWSRLTPVRALLEAGVAVGTGTDGAASNNTLDVLESLRFTAATQKYLAGDPTWFTTAQALELATRGSARAVGLEDEVGAIAPGHRADIVLLDTRGPHLQPLHDPAATLLYAAQSSDVTTVVVDGRIVMRDRVLATIDLDEVLEEVRGRVGRLTDRMHGNTLQTYEVGRDG